jgi:hypothetical protein
MNKPDDTGAKERPRESESSSQRDPEGKRVPLERVVFEVLRRGFGVGRDTLKHPDEALRSVSDSVFAKEAANLMVSQIGDVRQAVSKVVAKEVERYLGKIDLASELRKTLHGMTIEGNIKIKFNDLEINSKKDDGPPAPEQP